jgi:hypothetical protein
MPTITISWTDNTGIVAVYQVKWTGADHTNVNNFSLIWKSATKNGKPIDKLGNPISNNNTGGSSGGFNVAGIGPGADWTWSVAADPGSPAVTTTPTGTGYVDIPGFTDENFQDGVPG